MRVLEHHLHFRASQSQRLSFGIYRRNADASTMAAELDALIENVLSNLRNEPLVRKTSHAFEASLVHHIKGDKKFAADPYDDDLLNAALVVEEVLLDNEGKVSVIRNVADSSRVSRMQSPKSVMDDPVKELAAKTEAKADKSFLEKPVILQSEDNTVALQQDTERLSRVVEVVHPEENAANYGLRKDSVRPEVYVAYEKKLTELLNSVYLDDKIWTLVEETNGLKFWAQDHPHYVIQRYEIEIRHSLETVKDYVCDVNFRYKYDTLLKSIEIIESLSDQVALVRVMMKGSFPVSDRDFLTCRMMFYQNRDVRGK